MSAPLILQFCQSAPGYKAVITRGPWKMYCPEHITEPDETYWLICSGDGYFNDETRVGFQLSGFINKADAHLITSVPDLVEALQAIADSHVPDQPAADGCDESTWVRKHVDYLRSLAIIALKNAGNYNYAS